MSIPGFHSRRLHHKMFLFIFVFTLIPLTIVGIANIALTSSIFTKQLEQSSDIILSRTVAQFEQIYQEFQTAEQLFLRDEDLVSAFEAADTPIVRQTEVANQFVQYATNVRYVNASFKVSIILQKPHYLSQYGLPARSDPALLAGLPSFGQKGFSRAYMIRDGAEGRTFTWLRPFGNVLTSELHGCLAITVPYSNISKIMGDPAKIGQMQYLVTDTANHRLIPSIGEPEQALLPAEAWRAVDAGQALSKHEFATPDSTYFIYRIGDDWMLVGVVARKHILAPLVKVHQWTIGIILSQIALTSIMAIGLARNFSRPIEMLASLMIRKKNEGADIFIPKVDRKDEIGALYVGIRELLTEIRQEQIQKKEYRLRLLQYQINPHFLYNSLDTIQWKALEHRDRELSEMIRHLSNFLRLGLNQADIVSVEEELKHLNSYVSLQHIRHEGQFEIEVNVDETFLAQNIAKISLQPLVENAIMHGMSRQAGGSRIAITGKRIDTGTFRLSVFDDGQMLDVERVRRILDKRERNSASFGIWNVHERIKLYFGERYGLTVRKLSEGTSFDLELPYFHPTKQNDAIEQ